MNKEKVKSNFCLICGRTLHKKSKYCIFHASAEKKTEKEFIEALKEYVDKIKEEDKNYDFKNFIFVGNIDFEKDLNITSFNNANFRGAIFEGLANFEGTIFQEDANFVEVNFKIDADFRGANFKGDADFRDANFEGFTRFVDAIFKKNVSFARAIFEGYADLRGANFKGFADFVDAIFKKFALFGNAIFEGDANFLGTNFKGDANFLGTNFKGDAKFEIKTIKGNMYFNNAVFTYCKTLSLDIKNKAVINFEKAYLENVFLDFTLGEKTLINFTKTILRNTTIEKEQIKNHILQEKRKDFLQAKKIYLLLKNNFHNIGQYDDESWAFKKEKDMERKSYFHFKSLHKWLWSCFLNVIYGYGEKPERVIISAILIILIYAFVFMNYGIIADPQLDDLPKYNIVKELFMGIRYRDLLIRFKDISLEQIKNCLYFSTVTFTTLGLGDFCPVEGWGRIFVGTEAFIGALMMALFIYTFARRTGGR
jgi:uncharacterized protein YjbI with pentapeptide repeats